ncbi:MAG: hypothetical protein HOC83_01190 [Polaribacter sp.]|jgi:hypothetical protein|nr:hypothetical protein [Polaribacter sp.]
MSTLKKGIFAIFTLTSLLFFTSCEDSSNDIPAELTIQNKVEILKSGEWLLKGFEDRVMHTYKDGKQFTYYGTDSVFTDEAIPGTQSYTIEGDNLTFDYNFGNIRTFEVKISCDNNIIEFYDNGELNKTLYRRGSNYMNCL